MGLILHPRPIESVSDPLLDDAQLVDEPKERDARVFTTYTAESLTRRSSTVLIQSVSDLLLDDAQLVDESKEEAPHVTPTCTAESLTKHSSTILAPHPRPTGSVSGPLLDDAQLVDESKEEVSHVTTTSTSESLTKRSSILIPHPRPTESVSGPLLDDARPVVVPKERDPHVVPTFTSESLTKPSSTILYLPPLLSSLPRDLTVEPVSVDRPPLVTATRLPDIDPVSFSLHKALHHFRPLSEGYAGLPYALAFNWSELDLPEDEEREWYAVVFRSRRQKGSDSGPLYEADRQAHEEAVSNGGLLMYWYGIPDPETGMNLATCVWQSRKHAIAANSRPLHIRAMKLAAVSYEIYDLERYRLSKVKGEKGILVEEFSGTECGW